jgi:AcrR family transcriptional regulator
MARPVSIDNKAIVKAAREIFLRHGYSASTRTIADKAGVSEGSLFKHFKTKTDLFMAAMEDDAGISSWEGKLMLSAGKGDIRKNLEMVGRELLEHLHIILPRIMMVRSSGITIAPQCSDASGIPHPVQRLYALANYFKAEIRHGRLAMSNPQVYAQIFLGALVHYVFQKTVFEFAPVSSEVYIRTVVDMTLKAATPPGRSRKGAKK